MYSLVTGCPPSYLARINSLVLSLLACLCLCGLVCVLPMPLALLAFLNTPPSIWSQNPLDSLSSATHPSPLYEARRPAIFSIPARWSLQAADATPVSNGNGWPFSLLQLFQTSSTPERWLSPKDSQQPAPLGWGHHLCSRCGCTGSSRPSGWSHWHFHAWRLPCAPVRSKILSATPANWPPCEKVLCIVGTLDHRSIAGSDSPPLLLLTVSSLLHSSSIEVGEKSCWNRPPRAPHPLPSATVLHRKPHCFHRCPICTAERGLVTWVLVRLLVAT